uniref:deoxyribonuclease V n=1 Tax=Endozoicomonas sp. Mp262 TaxID=2919499 RepID=UPI00351AD520
MADVMAPVNHNWNMKPSEAIALQKQLALQVDTQDGFAKVDYVAGVDVGFEAGGSITRAAVAVLSFPDLVLREYRIARLSTVMPYIPGILSFRECPGILEALRRLTLTPDLVFCDGHGQAHPRGLGVACHLGLVTGLPCIGVAKKRLCGNHGELPSWKGAHTPLIHKEKVIGTVLRSRDGVKPLYVSIGHKISLETAKYYVQACLTRYRLPETTRWADALASNRGRALEKAKSLLSAKR